MKNREKTKIIYLVTKAGLGGAQKYVYDLATSLPRERFEVLVIHGEGDILSKKLKKARVRTRRIIEMGRDINIFLETIVFFKILKIFLTERPDIVHVNSSKAGGFGAFVARLLFVSKVIFTVHGWAFNEPRFNNRTTRFFSWLTVFFSTKTIVISRQNLEQTKGWPFVKNKFRLIYNGIKEIDFRDRELSRDFISKITKAPKDKPWLVTISELHENKGLDYLLDAVARLKQKPVVFIIGEGEKRISLEERIKNLGLKNIFLMGAVENASSYLRAFDIFTLTSIKEGLPYTILEAGLAQLPVIGTDIPGINDIIDNKNGVLAKVKSADDISEKIEALLEDKRKMAQLGDNLETLVKDKFSFEKTFKEIVSLY